VIEQVTPDLWLSLTPMRWSLLAAAATLGILAWRSRLVGWVVGIPLMCVPAALGPTPADTVRFVAGAVRAIGRAGEALVPRSATAWGFAVMIGAFVVLALGVGWSWWRGLGSEPQPPVSADQATGQPHGTQQDAQQA